MSANCQQLLTEAAQYGATARRVSAALYGEAADLEAEAGQ